MSAFRDLLPKHPEYRALREALAVTPPSDHARIATLRVNLERWRWMPRELGQRYLLVNVPAFSLRLVDGERIAAHDVIVGKPTTPTPQYSATVRGVILNPWWEVPNSIVAESVGELVRRHPAKARAQGYVVSRWPDGSLRIRQAPGPKNSLGQMKLLMPNPFNVYLHDTPAKALFAKPVRAFSHGCIRVKDAIDFAARLLADDPAWDRARIDQVLASGRTTTVPLARPLPVYVAYFTAATDASGQIVLHDDIYGRDAPVWRALSDKERLVVSQRDRPTQDLIPAPETCPS